MKLSGWGRYPLAEAAVVRPSTASQCVRVLDDVPSLITRGCGRSYGDSSLAATVLETPALDHFLAFDQATGLLTCEAGVTLQTILQTFVPKGWFLPVTPGTRFVTVGGAIASDVHGKNHHVDGSFCDHVTEIELLLGNGERLVTSPVDEPELFRATCGGMGLTGVILKATFRMKSIRSSAICETTIKTPDLDGVLSAFEENAASTYSVAWIDCLARGRSLGRSLLMLGEHAESGPLTGQRTKQRSIPFDMPSTLLNRGTVQLFNAFYYGKVRSGRHTKQVHFEPYFYPLDALAHWNRLYGKQGFVQYQFVLPREVGARGLRAMLERIASSGRGSFLAVLKAFGKGNQNLLSFPMEGYTLALDFKADPGVFELLADLDRQVLDNGGRIYLTKDARMSESTFKSGYPNWKRFQAIRERYHALGKFESLQSRRLGLQ